MRAFMLSDFWIFSEQLLRMRFLKISFLPTPPIRNWLSVYVLHMYLTKGEPWAIGLSESIWFDAKYNRTTKTRIAELQDTRRQRAGCFGDWNGGWPERWSSSSGFIWFQCFQWCDCGASASKQLLWIATLSCFVPQMLMKIVHSLCGMLVHAYYI